MRLRRFTTVPATVAGTIVLVAGVVGGLVAANGAASAGYRTATALTANSQSNSEMVGLRRVTINNLSATLTEGQPPQPVAGATIKFTITPRPTTSQPNPLPVTVCSSTTGAGGVASCSGSVSKAKANGVTMFTARFVATTTLAKSVGTGQLNP